jgi:hypothetical protein
MNRIPSGILAAVLAISSGSAQAAVVISKAATQNMSCAAGKCAPTAAAAILNVNDLEVMLGAGDVSVRTTAKGVEADDIRVAAKLAWSNSAMLSLVAHRSVAIAAAVTVKRDGGLTITTDNGGRNGDLTFASGGTINFRKVASKLVINGVQYGIAQDLGALASLIAAEPGGRFALANDFDLTTGYATSPIPTPLNGTLEGLGHTIANLEISTTDSFTGLFQQLNNASVVRDLKLSNVTIYSENSNFSYAGAVAGYSQGTVKYVQASGTLASDFWLFGGGLVGISYGPIAQSFANMNVSGADNSELGGLAGNMHGAVEDCYALGPANGGDESFEGGLIGDSLATVTASYSTGAVEGGQNAALGGFEGNLYEGTNSRSYWDFTTSGTDQGTGQGNVKGLKGLTTEQLQARLPNGFDPSIWAQDPNINSGLPYLINNVPGK